LKDKKVTIVDKPNYLPNSFENKIIILADDFIGSGTTAISALEYLNEELNKPKESIIILSLVAQQVGIEKIKEYGVSVFCPTIRCKGISDSFDSPKKEEYIYLMEEIEEYLNVDDDYKFGYKRSEALVKMERTPNNTFPVFWLESQLENGNTYKPLFKR
jgi:hypoxanthine phosphoribosyltransferase